jgi:rhodanese-related sulfurtransferase
VAGKAAEVAAPVVSRAADAARPVADAGVKYVERTAGPVANDLAGKAAQTASGAAATASDAIKARGIDLDPAAGAAKTAAGFAADKAADLAPSVASFGDFLQTATPVELVQTAGAAGALYLLAPAALGAVASAARGYAGSIRPVEAYDEALSGGNVVVVDVRSEADASRGSLEFPRRAAGRVVSVPREKLSGNFKNMGDVEATLTATKIASLKGVKKSTKVFVLDANGRGDGPKVAKALGTQGFGRVFVVEGGFNGWANAGLGISA